MVISREQKSSPLFDRQLLLARRERSADHIEQYDFLLHRTAEDMAERLNAITRDFPIALSLGGRHGVIGAMLRQRDTVGRVIEAESAPGLLAKASGLKVRCDDEFLPVRHGAVDLIVSALNLHFINDLPGTLIQINRALKPDGLFMAALMGGRTLFELREAFLLAEEEMEGGAAPHIAPMAEIRDCGALLQRAGFALPVADADKVIVTYKSALDLMRELRAMGGGNILHARRRTPMRRATIMRMAQIYMERFGADGRIPATFEIIHLAGWAPHHSQQQPLKPGSAALRLGDFIKPARDREKKAS